MTDRANPLLDCADCYGYPGPEGKTYWYYLAACFGLIFLAVATEPLWNHMG